MKLSLKWLSDHIDVADFFDKPMELADKLTDAGLEVEEVTSQAAALKNVVVGKIEKLGKHPDADKLTYCDINVGSETLKIVCGAKNHKEGDKVCVATIGAVLPGDFKIKKSKIRGVESFGMLCSEVELGLTEKKTDGILILPEDAPIGEAFSKYYGCDDVTFEVNVTPNRADCLSHLGLAREVSTLFGRPLKGKEISKSSKFENKKSISIDLKNSELCPRYMGQMVFGVKVGPSPEWLTKKLESVGMNSINNIVDITNYIMMDSGQPLHAFDASLINGGSIIIDNAVKGEAFTSLDGTEYKLSGEELTIRDSKGPVALAGVVGGENSGVTEKTVDVFIEAAHFIPSGVRKTSRSLGIDTDSAYRFSRGTDESRVNECLDEAVALVLEVAGGTPNQEIVEAYPNKKEVKAITVSEAYLNQRLGFSVTTKDVEKCFASLGFESSIKDGVWTVKPAQYRWDIEIKEDLVEEVGRIVGYDNIPEILPAVSYSPQNENSNYNNFKNLRSDLMGLGFNEAVHYNFYSSAQEASWGSEMLTLMGASDKEVVGIQNPLSSDLSKMRTSMVPQFVSNYIRNWRLGTKSGRIFEIGKAHFKSADNGYTESDYLCASVWTEDEKVAATLESLMSYLSELFEAWGVSKWRADVLDGRATDILHPKLSASIFAEGKEIGYIFSLNPGVAKENKVPSNLCGFEINLDKFLKGKPRPKKFKDFSRFPIVERDFSVTVDQSFSYDEVFKKVKKTSGEFFKSLEVHDVYQGDKIPEGKMSVTFRGRFQAKDKTLSEDELKVMQKKILAELASL